LFAHIRSITITLNMQRTVSFTIEILEINSKRSLQDEYRFGMVLFSVVFMCSHCSKISSDTNEPELDLRE